MLSLVFAVLMHGRPPIGTQFFIFYYTGIIPYHIFVHTSSSMTYAVTANGSLLQLPVVGTFDVILARGLLELVTDILVAVILLAGFGAIGLAATCREISRSVGGGRGRVWLLGCGFGFVNAVVNAFFKSWDKIWAQLTRILYFCSGIFYVPGMMPDWIARHARLEPGTARGRLVPRRAFSRLSAALARPLLSGAVAGAGRCSPGWRSSAVCAAGSTNRYDPRSSASPKAYRTRSGRRVVLDNANASPSKPATISASSAPTAPASRR